MRNGFLVARYLKPVTRLQAWSYGLAVAGCGVVAALPFRLQLLASLKQDPHVVRSLILFAAGSFASLFIHEAMHAVGFVAGGVPSRRLKFGWRVDPAPQLVTVVYAPVILHRFWVGMLFPAIVLGILPVGIGIVANAPLLVAMGVANLSGCGNDLAVCLATRDLSLKHAIEMDGERFVVRE